MLGSQERGCHDNAIVVTGAIEGEEAGCEQVDLLLVVVSAEVVALRGPEIEVVADANSSFYTGRAQSPRRAELAT
jgi:hypothetical protein